MRSVKRPAFGIVRGANWLRILSGLLALASGASAVVLTFRIADGERAYAEGARTLAEASPALVEGTAALEAGKQSLDEGREAYAEAEKRWHLVWGDRLFRGGRGFREAEEQIAAGERALLAGEDKIRMGQARLDAGRLKLQQGRKRLTFARRARWACAGSALIFAVGSLGVGFRACRVRTEGAP